MLGRARELGRVRSLLDDPTARLVSLRGPPGVGKSTLARALVASLRVEGRAVVSVSLAGLRERAEVLAALSAALARPSPSDDPRVVLDRVARALDEGDVTLVLDGVDGAREALAVVLRDLLDATERARAVACAWRRLGLVDEHVVALEPLAPDDAAQLFRRRVAQLAPARRVADDELRALVARTGGLPLAVDVVAARVASLGAAAVLASLDAHGLAGDALDRALDAAWEHLAPDDRRALAALSLFRAPFGADDAAALLARPDALDALERLVAASLVVADDVPAGPRFALLDGVRDHAARRLDDPRALARRHAFAFARPRPPPDAPGAWECLAGARADLLAAWRWGVENDPAVALNVALALDPLLVAQGPVALHREVLRESLARAPDDAPLAARLDLALALGRIDMIRGRARAALGPWTQAHALATRLRDPARVGWAAAYLAVALRPLGRLDEARAHARRALEAGAAAEDLALVAIARHALACVHHGAGDRDAADAEWERALASAAVARSPRLQGIMHANLARVDVLDGLLAARGGRHDEAARILDRALDVATAHDDLDGALEIREALAAVALDRDDRELAARLVALFAAAAQVADDVAWPARVAALQARLRPAAAPRRAVLRLARDGRTLLLDGAPVDLARRGPLRRVLVALFEARLRRPGEALDTHAVLAAGWPGERMFPESGAARVYMAVRRLRVLGLDAVLTTTDGGYALDPRADAAWLDAPDCQAM